MSTAKKLSDKDKKTDSLTKPRYSAVSKISSIKGTPDDIGAWLTSLRGDFHAKHFPRPPMESSQQPTYGLGCLRPFQQLSLVSSSQRMSTKKQLERLHRTYIFWVTIPGRLRLKRQTWAQITFGHDIGYVHTPTTKANYSSRSMQKWKSCRLFKKIFGKPCPINQEYLIGWPTGWTDLRPLATDRFHKWLRLHGRY